MIVVRWSAAAVRDLARIEAFLDQIDPLLALEATLAIREQVRRLLSFPAIGSPLPAGQRKLNERRFGNVIIYRVKASQIEILRILHAREDWR